MHPVGFCKKNMLCLIGLSGQKLHIETFNIQTQLVKNAPNKEKGICAILKCLHCISLLLGDQRPYFLMNKSIMFDFEA